MKSGRYQAPFRLFRAAVPAGHDRGIWWLWGTGVVALTLPATALADAETGPPVTQRRTVLAPTAGAARIHALHAQRTVRPTSTLAPTLAPTLPPRDPAAPHAHQRVHSGSPPISPAERNIEGGRLPVAPHPEREPETVWRRQRWISTNTPALPPGTFNPDPGGRAPATTTAEAPFFQSLPAPLPEYRGPELGEARPVGAGLVLPWWRRDTLVPTPLADPTTRATDAAPYESDPVTGQLALPRHGVRANEKLEFQSHGTPEYPLSGNPANWPPNTRAVPDRYREVGFGIPDGRGGFTPWRRYDRGETSEIPFAQNTPHLWHPYQQSRLKGDLPVWGQDKFLNLTATADTIAEFRRVPVPANVSTAQPDAAEFFGRPRQLTLQQYLGFSAELFAGETVFQPPHWTFKVMPVLNVNYNLVQENNLLGPDPRGIDGGPNSPAPSNGFVTHPRDVGTLLNGQLTHLPGDLAGTRYTDRTRVDIALQEYFFEYHVADLSDNYDFMAIKAGNQAFNQDFRGFLFNDVNLGGRFFGNYDNNRWQYNVLGFDMREKDTFSGLNSFDQRDQRVFLANAYRQDFLTPGYTAQWSVAANLDAGGTQYDRSDSIVRPEPFGTVRPHGLEAFYLGWAGEGHIGRWNISHQFYQALGHDEFNQLSGHAVDINAQMASLEVSLDRDWIRYKGSFFWASGDGNVDDGTARGFDTILDNPNFTGGPFSYYVRQGINLAGTDVALKQPGSLVPSLRTSKTQGQASFVNPGIFIFSAGMDFDVTPKVRSFLNFSYLRFQETEPLKTALMQDRIRSELGYDLSLGFQYRPFLTENIVITAGFGVLLPGEGFRDIYRRNADPVLSLAPGSVRAGRVETFFYSGVIALNFTY